MPLALVQFSIQEDSPRLRLNTRALNSPNSVLRMCCKARFAFQLIIWERKGKCLDTRIFYIVIVRAIVAPSSALDDGFKNCKNEHIEGTYM